ncbi:metallophosphoesterase [Aeromicrobium sp. 50.2.37]|uniref:metallophosphoesterase n=1 Tax=Aeromicrobium sp. 50.2.37 TaxID=2969305 RepID=UPI00214FA708|nr:metallophosphoesterase [Aeromicrobium sp. 50.2.37]MCR4514812.1 metallophosphoesterase [Aeromicrobium sp. 50.2.37]
MRASVATRPVVVGAGVIGASAAGLGYAWWEARWFALRHVSVPVLPSGARPLKVLHLSDAHLTPAQGRKADWLRSLADLEPDLVVSTGDHLAHHDAVPPLLEAYGELLQRPGVFVFGSNDYFAPVPKNPLKYLTGGTGTQVGGTWERAATLPFDDLREGLAEHGWLDLNNATGSLTVDGRRLTFAGVDDPHLELDDLAAVPPAASLGSDADLAVAVAHAPYLRVLDHASRQGYPLVLAGHTHGGQLCVPFVGALVTNCDLDRARVKGLSTHQVAGWSPSWLHVSGGLGTSPFAPVRFACRPEATLLTLTAIDSAGSSS